MKERVITTDKKYLLVPVGRQRFNFVSTAGIQFLQIFREGELTEEYELTLDPEPRSWSPIYLEKYPPHTELTVRLTGGQEERIELLKLSDSFADRIPVYSEPKRPLCHFSPAHGFLNDPNGLFYYRGEYHYFSQLNPFGYTPCNTHWLHAVSRDLYHWKELPYAILPGPEGRIYSGSGVVDYENHSGLGRGEDAPILLFYTMAGGKSRWSRGKPFQIGMACSTDGGKTFEKYPGNPLVPNLSFANRDPKVVWCEEAGRWIMAIYLDSDRYLLMTSRNLLDWTQSQILEVPGSAECPDLFRMRLDGRPDTYKWVFWGCTDNYIVGHMDETGKFIAETEVIPGPSHRIHRADWRSARSTGGYAAQTYFGAPEGRVIQQAWLRPRTKDTPFLSCVSVPNELYLVTTPEGPRLRVLPAREIENMYESTFEVHNRGLEEFERLPRDIFSECMDIRLTADIHPGRVFAVSVRGVLVVYDPNTGYLLLPTSAFEIGKDLKQLELRFVTDRLSVEIYARGGLLNTAVCQELDPFETALKPIWVESDFSFDLTVHKLGSIWETESGNP